MKDKALIYLNNGVGHFKTITRHKLTVMDLCFKVGLIRQGLLHDLSKYEPVEFLTGIRYYTGVRSPNAIEKAEKGYSTAWLHHKGRNRHHFEYWFDVNSTGQGEKVMCAKMPLKYVLEMVCDRIAACKVYHGEEYQEKDPYEYYHMREERIVPTLHPDTAALTEELLMLLRDRGERHTMAYMRYLMKHPGIYEGRDYAAYLAKKRGSVN